MGASVTKKVDLQTVMDRDFENTTGDDDVDSEGGDVGGGTRGCRHLQNDGNHRGRDPSGLNTSLEEEDNDDGNGTPAGAPDLMATV